MSIGIVCDECKDAIPAGKSAIHLQHNVRSNIPEITGPIAGFANCDFCSWTCLISYARREEDV